MPLRFGDRGLHGAASGAKLLLRPTDMAVSSPAFVASPMADNSEVF